MRRSRGDPPRDRPVRSTQQTTTADRPRSENCDLEQSDEGDAEDQDQSHHHGDGRFELKVVHGHALPGSER
jgi:hypothetical protein